MGKAGYTIVELVVAIFGAILGLVSLSLSVYIAYLIIVALKKYIGA